MRRTFYFILTILFLLSCKEKQEEKSTLLPELYGDWIPAGYQIISDSGAWFKDQPPPGSFGPALGFTFDSGGMVDTKQGYFRGLLVGKESRDRRSIYLGSKTRYRIIGDSLGILNLSDSTWRYLKIAKLLKDTLSFSYGPGVLMNFVRKSYNLDTVPTFDKIVVSTSGCYGACPISNTIIDSKGRVIFFGERYTTKVGFFIGSIPRNLYSQLQDNFRKADIQNISNEFSKGGSDQEKITVTFMKGDSIFKTISDYGNSSPHELIWAFIPVRHLYQNIDLTPLSSGSLQFHTALLNLTIEKGNKILELPQSESFLLWNYLRNGQITSTEFKSRFKINLDQNYYWFPSRAEEAKGQGYLNENSIPIKEITSDGRYFKFWHKTSAPVTIDIGFNFFDRNYSLKEFKLKEEY